MATTSSYNARAVSVGIFVLDASSFTLKIMKRAGAIEQQKRHEFQEFASSLAIVQSAFQHRECEDYALMPHKLQPPIENAVCEKRKRGREGTAESTLSACHTETSILPQDLTKETLQALEETMPLKTAAAVLGISPSALRAACRRVGMPRWAHRWYSALAAAAAVPAEKGAAAYARHLRRKYGK
jgi:hypothetical protein